MVDRIRYPTVSYLPFYYVFFQFLLLTIFNLQANILTTKDILSNLAITEEKEIYLIILANFQTVHGSMENYQFPFTYTAISGLLDDVYNSKQ